jgi:predicted RNA polymerase sigma factor
VVTLGRAVAVAEVHGPAAALAILGTLGSDARLAQSHRLHSVRAHLLEQCGELAAAERSYRLAARMTASAAEERYLIMRAPRLRPITGE